MKRNDEGVAASRAANEERRMGFPWEERDTPGPHQRPEGNGRGAGMPRVSWSQPLRRV